MKSIKYFLCFAIVCCLTHISLGLVTRNKNSETTIHLIHTGSFVARFYVSWEEVNCKKVVTIKNWEGNGLDRLAPFDTLITLPSNASKVFIQAWEHTGSASKPWLKVMDVKTSSKTGQRIEIKISGTTSDPKLEVGPPYLL